MGSIPLHIIFGETDVLTKIYYGIIYLVSCGPGQYDEVYDRIKYLEKSGIRDSINHNFGRTRINSDNSLPIEKILTFYNVLILIKLVVNENKNNYYYNIFYKKVHIKINQYTIFLMNVCIS